MDKIFSIKEIVLITIIIYLTVVVFIQNGKLKKNKAVNQVKNDSDFTVNITYDDEEFIKDEVIDEVFGMIKSYAEIKNETTKNSQGEKNLDTENKTENTKSIVHQSKTLNDINFDELININK